MTDATKNRSGTLGELAELKTLTLEVAESLRTQDEMLRTRGMKLPPGVNEHLASVIKDIASLEDKLAGDAKELAQLRALASTGAMINSTLDVDSVLARAMDKVIELAGAERGFMILRNEDSGDLAFRITRDNTIDAGNLDSPQVSMTIVREVVSTGVPLLTDNAYKDPRIQDNMSVAQFVLRSVICVPLTQRDKTIGAIYVDNRLRAGVFTQRELNLLTAFANQAAVAIENARLYARIQSSLREITEIKDVMDNVFASVGSGIITTNADNMVISVNRAVETLLDVSSDEAVGKHLLDVLPQTDDIDLESQMQMVQEQGAPASFQVTAMIPRRHEPAILTMKFSPLRDQSDNTQGVTVVVDDLTEQNEREAMIEVLQSYLPPGMMSRIQEIAQIDLGGERRDMTCMFVETVPVSSFPPGANPEDVMNTINRYLSVATAAIHKRDGVIDKYMGTDVMVLFNTQLNPQPDHAIRAMEAALDVREAFINFYEELNISPDPHLYRIGIHTGIATLGNVGSMYRRNFTAIGDTINLSKRLEENAVSSQIIISEDTLLKAREILNSETLPGIRIEEREPIKVKGRQQYTPIYEIFRE